MSTGMSSAPSIARDREDFRTSVSLAFGFWHSKPLFRFARSIKGRVKRKNNPGDWKERSCSQRSPAQVMLRGFGVFALRRSISVFVAALSDSEARQAARLNVVNHGSI